MGPYVRNKDEILRLIESNKPTFRDFGVVKLGLFGSYVRNEQKEDSDIDLIVEFEAGKKTYSRFFSLSEFLEKLFNKRVDLLTDKGISPYMKPSIEKEAIYVSFSY